MNPFDARKIPNASLRAIRRQARKAKLIEAFSMAAIAVTFVSAMGHALLG